MKYSQAAVNDFTLLIISKKMRYLFLSRLNKMKQSN